MAGEEIAGDGDKAIVWKTTGVNSQGAQLQKKFTFTPVSKLKKNNRRG